MVLDTLKSLQNQINTLSASKSNDPTPTPSYDQEPNPTPSTSQGPNICYSPLPDYQDEGDRWFAVIIQHGGDPYQHPSRLTTRNFTKKIPNIRGTGTTLLTSCIISANRLSSEICFSGNSNHQLHWNRVKLSSTAGDQHVKLSLLSYKHSKGTRLPIILKARDDCTCPFQAAKAYLKKRKSKVPEFICHENGKHVTRSQIAGKLQLTLQVLGKRPASYNTQSFRIGKISDMATSGSSQPQLMMAGKWQSNNAHQPYIKPSAVKL